MERKFAYTDIQEEGKLNMADFYFFKDVFTDDEINKITELALKYPAEKAGTGQDDNEDYSDKTRKSTVRWMFNEKGKEDWIMEKLMVCVNEANDNMWRFNLNSAQESIQYTEYPPQGGHYDWHMDCGHGIQKQRKISITVQLNDDYDGGELELWRGQNPQRALKEKGTVVVFPSYMMHRVRPVTKGIRNSLVLWVGGDHYR